jgi:hypothetical protein
MKTNCAQTKTILLLLGAAMFTLACARADTRDLLTLGEGVYFTAGIADEEHGLFGLITEDAE